MGAASMMTKRCECCGSEMQVRVADHNRGWGNFCSKSCKAIKQTNSGTRRSSYPRHDGRSEMKHKVCEDCGEPAVNGVYGIMGRIEWYCAHHMALNSAHPFSSEALQP